MEEIVKLKVLSKDQDQNLAIDEVDGRLNVEIDGRKYEVEVHYTGEHSYLLLHNNQVFDCRVARQTKSHDRFAVSLRGHRHSVAIIDPRRLRSDENSDRHHDGLTEISAQMPGKVVRVLVEVGTKVEKGDGIVVVEAMKMQNEMKSPRAGVVVSLSVTAGDTVNAGEMLAAVGEAES
jgi:biotin carboxyl carrier protein